MAHGSLDTANVSGQIQNASIWKYHGNQQKSEKAAVLHAGLHLPRFSCYQPDILHMHSCYSKLISFGKNMGVGHGGRCL